jgi:hypothetical protein
LQTSEGFLEIYGKLENALKMFDLVLEFLINLRFMNANDY